jgi:hypothetical protein
MLLQFFGSGIVVLLIVVVLAALIEGLFDFFEGF